ncbi:MAG: hypothetical protein HY928_16150 [Elusimicrobia bacterium]|nr:hypothetical protein [Elusimicrobiota bacterium]
MKTDKWILALLFGTACGAQAAAPDALRTDGAIQVQASRLRRNAGESAAKMRSVSEAARALQYDDVPDTDTDDLRGNECRGRFWDFHHNGLGRLFGACHIDFKAVFPPGEYLWLHVWAEGDGNRREIWAGDLGYRGTPRFVDDDRDGRGSVLGVLSFDFIKWRRMGAEAEVRVYAELSSDGPGRKLWTGKARTYKQ